MKRFLIALFCMYSIGLAQFPESEYTWNSNTEILTHFNDVSGVNVVGNVNIVSGVYDKAVEFTEGSYISVPADSLSLGGEGGVFTLEFCYRGYELLTRDPNNVGIPIVSQYSRSPGWKFWVHPSDWPAEPGHLEFSWADGTNPLVSIISQKRIDDSTWHHIALVRYTNVVLLLIDGEAQFTYPVPPTLPIGNRDPIILGKDVPGSAIDELRISNIALDTSRLNYQKASRTLSFPFGVTHVEPGKVPTFFTVSQNYPNPFNATTNIGISLESSRNVTLRVMDNTGRVVETLMSQYLLPGDHNVVWNADRHSSGVYFYQVVSRGSKPITRRMILIK